MSTGSKIILSSVISSWLGLVVFLFILLSTAIEIQSAAYLANKNESKLSTLKTVQLSRTITEAENNGNSRSKLASLRKAQLNKLFQARTELRSLSVEILMRNGVEGASEKCTAPPKDLNECQINQNMASCTVDWLKITGCYAEAFIILSKKRPDENLLSNLSGKLQDARNSGYEFNSISQRLKEANELESDPLFPVAQAYRNINLFGFKSVYTLPKSVLFVCFTSLMAALGASVSATFDIIKKKTLTESAESVIVGFIFSPIMGAMIGFMVYFVISVGTGFLTSSSVGGSGEVSNNLSVEALASLGVLAGLSAENALRWLKERSESFFTKSSSAPVPPSQPAAPDQSGNG